MEHGGLTEEMLDRLLAERARVQGQLDQLTATRDRLDEVIRQGRANRAGQGRHAGESGCATAS
jgi:hypothetical protein